MKLIEKAHTCDCDECHAKGIDVVLIKTVFVCLGCLVKASQLLSQPEFRGILHGVTKEK